MDPTRPIDSKPIAKPGAKSIGQGAKVASATQKQGSQRQGAAQLADSVADAGKVIEAGKAEAQKVDAARLDELKELVQGGRYTFDADALAGRMLDDAFGEEDI